MNAAFLFPGQGAQHIGMGSGPAAKEHFDRASTILGYDLHKLCTVGPVEELNATNVAQPAIFVASWAALESLKLGEPALFDSVRATAGLSLGEYTALAFSGAISFEDAVAVVKARGEAMQAAALATPSGMIAILGLEIAEVEALVAEARSQSGAILNVANLLCPGNTVVSGANAALEELTKLAEARQLRIAKLAVAGAFHTDLMKPADEKLAEALSRAKFQKPRIPIWSNVDAQPHTDPAEIQRLLVRQVLSPVRWEETLRGLLMSGIDKFYEIGPGRVLAGLLKRVDRKASLVNVAG